MMNSALFTGRAILVPRTGPHVSLGSWGVPFWGAFAAFGYAASAGRRDFTSLSVTVPSSFEVLVAAEHSERARTVIAAAVPG